MEKKHCEDWEEPAFPTTGYTKGVNKREYFAALAMQGICASNGWDQSMDGIVKASVEMADKLLKEFEKQQ
jgi:hypothetical protein